jgi:nucleoside-diphosphate-sugar epimerase
MDQLIGDAVVVAIHLDVVIDIDPGGFPFGKDRPMGGEGFEDGSFQGFKETLSETVNIACGKETSLNQLIALLKKILGSKVSPIHRDSMKGDVRRSLADIRKGRRFLNYDPKIGMEVGLEKTVEYFKGKQSH